MTDASPDFEVPLRSHFGQARKRFNRGNRVARVGELHRQSFLQGLGLREGIEPASGH